MKTYNVEMEMTFKKMLRVAAPTADDAIDLAEHLMEEPDVFCFDRSELSETEVGVRPVDTDEFCFCRCMACEDAACCGCCMRTPHTKSALRWQRNYGVIGLKWLLQRTSTQIIIIIISL